MATAKAIAAYRGARAVELAVAGWSYDQITAELGYRSSGAVSKAVWRTIHRRAVDAVDAYREQQLARLDALEQAHWTEALGGSTAAAEVVLSVVAQRTKLLALDRDVAAAEGPTGVVDPGYCGLVQEGQDRKVGTWEVSPTSEPVG